MSDLLKKAVKFELSRYNSKNELIKKYSVEKMVEETLDLINEIIQPI